MFPILSEGAFDQVTKGIIIPTEMFKKMLNTYYRMEQIIATLETMADKEIMKAIKKANKKSKKENSSSAKSTK
jgi:hypothetical protein